MNISSYITEWAATRARASEVLMREGHQKEGDADLGGNAACFALVKRWYLLQVNDVLFLACILRCARRHEHSMRQSPRITHLTNALDQNICKVTNRARDLRCTAGFVIKRSRAMHLTRLFYSCDVTSSPSWPRASDARFINTHRSLRYIIINISLV